MKKYVFSMMLLIMCLLVVGCGNSSSEGDTTNNNNESSDSNNGTLTCTTTETDEDGFVTEKNVEVTYEDNIVTKVVETDLQEYSSDSIDFMLSFAEAYAEQLNDIDGFSVEYSKESDSVLKSVITVDYTKLDVEALKEAYGDEDDSDDYLTDTNISIDDYKEEYLEGYSCN